jgi:uncharacterized protein with von Willebrand factor type A (vWA) domain
MEKRIMVKNDELAVFVALDRSGSMSGERWTTAIESLNDYIKGLQKEKIEGEVTVVAFDSHWVAGCTTTRLETITENKSIAYFEPLKHDVLHPAGGTPLYDAAANVMDRALERNAKRTVVVILTDGEENQSREYTQQKIKDKVKILQEKNWEVIFLGANFDVTTYTAQAGLASTKMRSVDFTNKFATATMSADLWSTTASYARTGAAMNMSPEVKVK